MQHLLNTEVGLCTTANQSATTTLYYETWDYDGLKHTLYNEMKALANKTVSTNLWNRGCRLLHSQLFFETGAAGFYTLRIIIQDASWTLSQKLSYNDKQRINMVNAARVELGVGDDTNHITLKEPPANTEWHIFLFLPYLNRMLNHNSG